jgi:hypothetical protein
MNTRQEIRVVPKEITVQPAQPAVKKTIERIIAPFRTTNNPGQRRLTVRLNTFDEVVIQGAEYDVLVGPWNDALTAHVRAKYQFEDAPQPEPEKEEEGAR